jgi:DNA-binding transcriptional ArsR family regulator
LPTLIDQTFSALADPTRRAILARLAQGQTNVSELAQPFLTTMSLPAITKHIKVLERAGLIVKSRDKQSRPCRLNAPALKEAADWIETYRAHWEDSFDHLDIYLKSVTPSTKEEKTNEPPAQR